MVKKYFSIQINNINDDQLNSEIVVLNLTPEPST
jgi:hypothetical protein